ncbi:hypothetical protein JMJ55_19445 [Belnapia sp. T6]|uniref:Uncharacterized protein n=1 Tax=Belnapia mucosa TaxID=2804532 RepID=A0ABS1V781_9PROT|nr:hypothetical protein [Belnapia mucosa]MBL6457511.1 hypothetical protein [Belnapia mucosa]
MQFDADAVHRLLAMLEPGAPAPGEAARLAAEVGSWPEMLAHLLLRRGSFEPWPELSAALRAPMARFRGGPLNRRPQARAAMDVQRQEGSQQALEAALAALIEAERARAEPVAAADAALRAHVEARPRGGFDLHHRIRPGQG